VSTTAAPGVPARLLRAAPWVALVVVLVVLPQVLQPYWVNRVTGWIPLAIAALGLNLLTGYNGQISVGHGALYGLGAYATALVVNEWDWPFLAAIAVGAVVCFGAGVVIGLPALRIKGLYLALVTLAVATLFPQLVEQFSDTTGGTTGLAVTSLQEYRGRMRERSVKFEPPEWTGLAADQWRYYLFLALAAVCFVIVANIVSSRVGRSLVAIRDNEVAAEVSGVNVAATKVFTFGISAALAGVGGGLLALYNARVSSGSFTLAVSLYFLVAVVLGGPATTLGPALGAVLYGLFKDVVEAEVLPEAWKPASPLLLGALLVVTVLVAPGGIVGTTRQVRARFTARRLRGTTPP